VSPVVSSILAFLVSFLSSLLLLHDLHNAAAVGNLAIRETFHRTWLAIRIHPTWEIESVTEALRQLEASQFALSVVDVLHFRSLRPRSQIVQNKLLSSLKL
jgi:hypothetical protein